MILTREEIGTLSKWERNFHDAVDAQWGHNPGRSALKTIWEIYTRATGDRRRFSDNCSTCILNLLTDCGRVYFADKAELERFDATRKVEKSEVKAKPVKKAPVKTRTKKA